MDYRRGMCRSIKPLFNFEPAASEEEVRAAALQFVRKIAGFRKPSRVNEAAFFTAVDDIAHISSRLLDTLESNSAPKDRRQEASMAKQRFRVPTAT